MPTLPTVNNPRPVAQGRRAIASYDGTEVARATAQAGAEVGGAITQAADKAIEQQDRYGMALAKSSFLKNQIETENSLDQDQDYATYEKRYSENMTKAREASLGMVKSPFERQMLQQDLDLNIVRGLGNVRAKAKSKEIDVGRGTLMDTIASNREIALQSTDEAARTGIIQATTDAINGARDRGYLSEQDAVRMRRSTAEDYALGSVQMLDPAGRIAALNKPGIADLIPTDTRAQLKMQAEKQIETEQRQRQVESRQMQAINRMELSSRVQNAEAAYLQGFEYENPPSKADFVASFGEERGAQKFETFTKVQSVAAPAREFFTATPQEMQETLSKYAPAQGGVAGEGFKEDTQLHQHLTRVATGLLKERQTDPAAYVARYSPIVQESFAAAQKEGTPEAYQQYVRATFAEQERLGVLQPKLLPESAVDQMAAEFDKQIQGGENAVMLIEQQQALWGKSFPAVLKQVGNKLPPEAQVIATGLPKDVAERMASVASVKDGDLFSGLAKGQKDTINQQVQEQMSGFAGSLLGQVGGINTYSTAYAAATRTAASYVLQGMDPGDAAKKVVNGMVNDKYDFFETYRVPKSGLNTTAVSIGANRAKNQLKPEELEVLPGLSGVTDEANLSQYHAAVQNSGQWVTDEDERGLVLTLGGYKVFGSDRKPIVRSWSELQQQGRPHANVNEEALSAIIEATP